MIDYKKFIESKKVHHCEAKNVKEVCEYSLSESVADIISYSVSIPIFSGNGENGENSECCMIKFSTSEENGNRLYKYIFTLDVHYHDIVDNFSVKPSSDVTISYIINDHTYGYSELDSFIPCAAVYNSLQLVLTYINSLPRKDSILTYRCFRLKLKDRISFRKNNIRVRNMIYTNGVCIFTQ